MADLQLSPVLDELTKKSIDLLGRLIKKPPLTQKLLAKPPFRYLHDLFSELISTAGFAPGLYNEIESNSENVKDKDAKVAYLTKMIDCVGLATGVEIRANPLKIVAGLEPEETNAFLQLIAKVILKKVDTSAAVARVLAGEHQGAGSKPILQQQQPSNPLPQPTSSASLSQNQATHQQSSTLIPSKESLAPPAEPQPVKQSEPRDRQEPPVQQPSRTAQEQPPSKPLLQNQTSSGSMIPSKLSTQRTGSTMELDAAEASQNAGDEAQENKASAPRRRERPVSARPPPPKKKSAQPVVEEVVVAMPTIINDAQKDDDDDEFVVQAVEAPVRLSSAGTTKLLSDEKHGGLVQKILQTKKDLIGPEGEKDASKITGSTDALNKNKNTALREIEELRESIQILCQSANPLGKTLDYIQEDADSMNKELDHWKKESARTKALLVEEVKTTKSIIEPLQVQLREIEDSIRDQMDKIANVKASIIQNDNTISKLLRNITNANK